MRIGFIGLGIMGKPMAKNLIKAGHSLTVTDHHQKNMDDVAKQGAKIAKSAREAAADAELVITMLQNSPQVEEAVAGPDGVLDSARPGTIVVDTSSIAPLASQKIAALCAKKQVTMLDAPVSGGEPKAVDGSLSIMVGGDKAVFERIKDDVLLKMGASAVHCGAVGAGNTTKLANQVIVAANIAAVSEAFILAKKAGVDPNLVFEAIRGGLAGSAVMNAKAPMMLSGDFKPGFRVELHIKDLANALATAHEVGAPLPITAQIMEMFSLLRVDGAGKDDHSALVKLYEKIAEIKLTDSE
ncbi:MAG: 2-hydroxy-3-oxopropionate reductase [Planctomycetes bacterium]|nr:2-hydroxy-3-oxopropionate reductase [Planctomycetota bacterium]